MSSERSNQSQVFVTQKSHKQIIDNASPRVRLGKLYHSITQSGNKVKGSTGLSVIENNGASYLEEEYKDIETQLGFIRKRHDQTKEAIIKKEKELDKLKNEIQKLDFTESTILQSQQNINQKA